MSTSPAVLDPSQIETPSVPLTELGLVELRRYRRRLAGEEDRVSYWRRVLHARIDVLRAEGRHERPLSLEELVRALGDTGAGSSRRVLVTVEAAEPLPQLPILKEIWVTDVDPANPSAVAAALDRLGAAEGQLTAYRRALHACIDHATTELIDRYRIDPRLALTALPQPPRRPLVPPERRGR